MKSIAGRATLAVGLVALAVAAVAAKARTADKAPETGRDSAEQAALVAKTIAGSARALNDFPRTRNVESVLAFYAKDYTGIENGEETSLNDQRQLLSDLAERIGRGESVGISSTARNVRVRVAGSMAWATYDYVFKIAVGEEDWDEEDGKCSSVLEKSGSTWLLEHEHCSSVCPDEDDEESEGEESPHQDKT
jgi:ketosteroid isomerase-like protein